MGALDWMADVLRAAGLTVIEYPNWRNIGTGGTFAPKGALVHHDASALGPSPTIPHMIAEVGNSTTPPPLSQCWVDTFGAWTLTASGKANHAGTGSGWGVIRADQGNTDAIGVETDHTTGEAWPPAQLEGLRAGLAAIFRHTGWDPYKALCGHKEYTSRKIDPDGLNMDTERAEVARRKTEVQKKPHPVGSETEMMTVVTCATPNRCGLLREAGPMIDITNSPTTRGSAQARILGQPVKDQNPATVPVVWAELQVDEAMWNTLMAETI